MVGKPLHQFPTKQQIAEHTTPLRAPLGLKVVEPDAWKLELPAPVPNTPIHALLPVLAPGAIRTPALDCTAHEIGRIVLQTPDKVPSTAVTRFIAARCGAVVTAPQFRTWVVQAVPAVTDAALLDPLRGELVAGPTIKQAEVGAAIVRDQSKAIVVISSATPQLSVGAANVLIDTDTTFRLNGRVLFDTDAVEAYINVGESAVARCELDPAVALPEFSAACPVAASDDWAWVQVTAAPRGRVISHEVYQAIVMRRADVATIYHPKRAEQPQLVSDNTTFASTVVNTLNTLRQRIGLRALKPAHGQSQLASQVTPSLFAALERPDAKSDGVSDLLALGLMAGWDVDGGTIRNSQFVSNLSIDSLDAGRWLADLLEVPIGRAVLLDPHAHELAIGAVVQQEPAVIAAIALTYAFFEREHSPGDRARQLAERLTRMRNARKLGSTTLVSDTPGLQAQLTDIQRGAVAPEDALNTVMQNVVDVAGRNVQGFIWDTHELDAIEFPEALLRRGDLTIAVGVTYYRAPEAAWGQYCVLFVVIDTPRPLEA